MGKADDRRKDKARAQEHADERRRVVLRVYQSCDEATSRKLAQLARKPSCVAGCSHCCSLEVPVTRAEVETMVAWLHEQRTPEQLAAIRERLHGWLAWYRGDYERLVASGMSRVDAFFRHGPPCALLDDHRCSAYPVRPITCRNHYVASPASSCDPAVGDGNVEVMESVAAAASSYVAELRATVERQGGNYLASVHLLQEWLAHLLEVEHEPWVTRRARR
jgi:hypothetical protein